MGVAFKGCGSCFLFVMTTWAVYKLSLPVFLESLDPEGNMPSDNRLEPKLKRVYRGHHVICHHFYGTMPEQLFQYASLLALAKPQDRMIISKDGNSVLEDFLVELKVKPSAAHCHGVEKVVEKFCCRDDDRFINLDVHKNYDFEGHLETWTYFQNEEDYVKKEIQFQKPILRKAKKVINDALKSRNIPNNKILVGIHVKRGQLVEKTQIADGFRVAPKEYFEKAIDHFKKDLKNPVFIVVSEDVDWCISNLPNSKDMVHIPVQKEEVAMAMFTLVQHAIISVGPFSWWAGFLTKGKVIYFKNPIVPDSKMMTEYGGTLDKTFKPSWTPMG